MPRRPNRDPNGEWKAIVLSYDEIFSLPERKCNYCLTEQQAIALVQIAEYLSWQTRWVDAAGGKDNDKLVAFAADIQRELMSGCCGDEQEFPTRYNSEGIKEISYDDGITWVTDPAPDPRFDGTLAPMPVGIPSEDLKCLGAANVVAWFQEQETKTVDALGAGGGVSGIIAALFSLILLFLGVTTGAVLFTPLLLGLASALAVTTAEAFASAMNEDVYDRLLCTIFCNISNDGSFTKAQWQAIKVKILDDETGIARQFLYDNINTLGTVGLTNVSHSAFADEYDCSDCDCSPPCIDDSNIIIGNFVSEDDDEITIEGVLATYGDIEAYWVVYGSIEPNFCCLFCEVTYIPDVTSGGWKNCEQATGGGTPVGQMVGRLEYYRTLPFSIKFRFATDEGCA